MRGMKPDTSLPLLGLALASLLLSACAGGSKLLREPVPLVIEAPLVSGGDAQLSASLDWVIIPGGPGTWAKNAYWDEYLLTVESEVPWPLAITGVAVVDGLRAAQPAMNERKQLVAATKDAQKRFRKAGYDPQVGAGVDGLMAAGAIAGGYGAFAGAQLAAALAPLGVSSGAATAMAASGAVVVGGPVLAVGGIVRSVNNHRVNDEILARQAALPLTLEPGTPTVLHVFVPITPGPRRVDVQYRIGALTKTVTLDVADDLGGLHLAAPETGDDQ